MKRIFGFILLVIIQGTPGFSQPDSLQKEINEHVWKPFVQSFNNLNTEGFMAVHRRDMYRVIQDANLIYGYDKYSADLKQGNEKARRINQKRTIELRFVQRIAASDKAFEVGYYRFTSFDANGITRNAYGKFHVLLRKENGIWKILMDADASEKINEQVFMSAKAME